jgi:hypothetical protein
VKHIHAISLSAPQTAAIWQDIVCYSAAAFQDLLTAKGTSLPLVDYLVGKCDLPEEEE